MFWNTFSKVSNIDSILDEPDVKLEQLLDEATILEEIKSGSNKKLIDYLSRQDIIHQLLDYIVTLPSDTKTLEEQYKYPMVATEVLTASQIFGEKISASKDLVEKLFHFFRDNKCLNPLLASYVSRILSDVIVRKADQNWYSYQLNIIQVMGYLQSETDVINWILNHLDTSAVCDFIYKLIKKIEGQDMRTNLFQWLDKENFIYRLIEKMGSGSDREVHANINRVVGDLLHEFRDDLLSSSNTLSDAEPFLLALISPGTINTLLSTLFDNEEVSQSSIIHGLDLLLALLGITKNPSSIVSVPDEIKEAVLNRLGSMKELLVNPKEQKKLILTHGVLEPLGAVRLAIAKFIAQLLTLHDDEINNRIMKEGILEALLNLFWAYPYNSFLHRFVTKAVVQLVETESNDAIGLKELFIDYKLLEKIIDAFETNNKCSYRGHLDQIASLWSQKSSTDGPIKDMMDEYEKNDKDSYNKWDNFMLKTLFEYQINSKILLGDALPPTTSSASTPQLPFDNDGVYWGMTALTSTPSFNPDFENNITDSFNNLDKYEDEKSKALFEIFCSDNRSSNPFDDQHPFEEDVDENIGDSDEWAQHIQSSNDENGTSGQTQTEVVADALSS